MEPRTSSRRLPFVLGALVIVGAIGAIAIAIADSDSDSDSSSSEPRLSYNDIGAPPRQNAVLDVAAVPPPPAPPTPTPVDAAAARAMEDVEAAPPIATVEAALRDKNLRDAKAAIAHISTESVEYPAIKRTYELAEAQAIAELSAQLERATAADCAKYHWLLGKARAASPPRVTADAARRTPCPPATCDAVGLAEKGKEQLSASRYAEALASFEAAYACRPAAQLIEKAVVAACNLRNIRKAKHYWKQLPAYVQSRTLAICVRNGITEATLNAPRGGLVGRLSR
jgi:hypothetical protein